MVSPVVRKDDTLPRGRQRPTVKKRYPRFCVARECNRPDLDAGFKRRRTSRVRFAGEREKRANARNGSVIPSKSLCAAGPNMRGHTEGAIPAPQRSSAIGAALRWGAGSLLLCFVVVQRFQPKRCEMERAAGVARLGLTVSGLQLCPA